MKQKGEKELKIHNRHAEVIKRVFELKQLHKQWSLSKLTEKLNEEGYRTTQDKQFTKVQVKRILDRQSFYKGVYTYGEIAEIGYVTRFPNANKLARFAGIAPVYFGSGGKGKEQKSKQGNRALHALFYNLAVQQVQVAKGSKLPRNAVFYAYYQRKLKEDKIKGQALVCTMRRLENIIYGMMKHKTAYELLIVQEKEVRERWEFD